MNNNKFVVDGMTVLIAEDDPDDRLIIERAFHEIGFAGNLCFVENGEQLIGFLSVQNPKAVPAETRCPLCILLDLNMPLLDGKQAIRHIRHHLRLDDISVVILTTSDSNTDKEYCLKLGATAFITKPSSVKELALELAGIECIGRLLTAGQ
jgi:CheY-like chemotaxis protein